MYRAGYLRRCVAANAARERELLEKPAHALGILRHVWIELAVAALKPGIGCQRWPAVTRTCDVDHIEVMLFDDPIQMSVDEIQTWRRAPMAEQTRFDVLRLQRLVQERIVEQINLADRQI